MRTFAKSVSSLGLAVALVAISHMPIAATSTQGVPEVSASSLSAGMGLLAAGVLILRARRRLK